MLFDYCNGAQGPAKYHEPAGRPQLQGPPESHRKSWNFKPVSKAPKVIKIGPKVIENHVKMTPKST